MVVELPDDVLVVVDDLQLAVVVVHVSVGVDETHVERGHIRETVDVAAMLLVKVVEEFQTQLRVLDHLIDRQQSISAAKEPIDVGGGQALVHATGHGRDAVHPFAEDRHEHFLTPLAQPHYSLDQLGIRLDQSENIALFGWSVDTEQHLRKH